jgi:hypothetical protein
VTARPILAGALVALAALVGGLVVFFKTDWKINFLRLAP